MDTHTNKKAWASAVYVHGGRLLAAGEAGNRVAHMSTQTYPQCVPRSRYLSAARPPAAGCARLSPARARRSREGALVRGVEHEGSGGYKLYRDIITRGTPQSVAAKEKAAAAAGASGGARQAMATTGDVSEASGACAGRKRVTRRMLSVGEARRHRTQNKEA